MRNNQKVDFWKIFMKTPFIKIHICPINGAYAHTFLDITQPSLGWKFFMETQETNYLSIGGEKSKVWYLFFSFNFFDHFWQENGRRHHKRPLWFEASKPDQTFGPIGGPFGSNAISKSCFRNLYVSFDNYLLLRTDQTFFASDFFCI